VAAVGTVNESTDKNSGGGGGRVGKGGDQKTWSARRGSGQDNIVTIKKKNTARGSEKLLEGRTWCRRKRLWCSGDAYPLCRIR